jgi:hypothetical protein
MRRLTSFVLHFGQVMAAVTFKASLSLMFSSDFTNDAISTWGGDLEI